MLRRTLLAVFVLLICFMFALFIWPTPFTYLSANGIPVRVNRFNGWTEFLVVGAGWEPVNSNGRDFMISNHGIDPMLVEFRDARASERSIREASAVARSYALQDSFPEPTKADYDANQHALDSLAHRR